MAYTEIKNRNTRKYYYRVKSIRKNNKISKKRIYLGVDLKKEDLSEKVIEADKMLMQDKINKKIMKIFSFKIDINGDYIFVIKVSNKSLQDRGLADILRSNKSNILTISVF